jgi:hypothetical protein
VLRSGRTIVTEFENAVRQLGEAMLNSDVEPAKWIAEIQDLRRRTADLDAEIERIHRQEVQKKMTDASKRALPPSSSDTESSLEPSR